MMISLKKYVPNIRINWDSAKDQLKSHLLHDEFIDTPEKQETLERIFLEIDKYLSTSLECSFCKKMLPDESFHRGSAFKARRGRQTLCKFCIPIYRNIGVTLEEPGAQ